MFQFSELVTPIMASILLSFVIFQTSIRLNKNVPFFIFYIVFFVISMLLINFEYNEIEKYSNEEKKISAYIMASGAVLIIILTLKSFIEKRIYWNLFGVIALFSVVGLMSGQFFSLGETRDKVTLSEARSFMQRQCDEVNQTLVKENTKDFGGRKQYYFLSHTRDFSGQACISIISEDALEIISTSCGPADVKLEEWNNMY
jgi:hypothetical protein